MDAYTRADRKAEEVYIMEGKKSGAMAHKASKSILCAAVATAMILATTPMAYALGAGETFSERDRHMAVVKADGGLWSWGNNWSGAVGITGANSTQDDVFGSEMPSPYQTVPVKILDGVKVVSAGKNHAAAVKTDGSLWTWGDNSHGQLGNGEVTINGGPRLPTKVMEGGVRTVSAGVFHTEIIKTDGSLWSFGFTVMGGNAKGYNGPCQTIPIKVMDDVASVSAGDCGTLAVKTDGSLWSWLWFVVGGTPGDGTITGERKPVKIMDDVASAYAGDFCNYAVKTDGSLWGWGQSGHEATENNRLWSGIQGNSAEDGRSLQTVPVKLMDSVASISADRFVLKTDGSLWNMVGTPVKLLDGVRSISGSLALGADGSVWDIGDGTPKKVFDGAKLS